MDAPLYRETLEKFYHRAYGGPRPVRFVSISVVAVLTAYLEVWPTAWAFCWAAAYVACEFALVFWWAKIQPRLRSADARDVERLQGELIAICAFACAICAIPSFFTIQSTPANQVLGAFLSAGILLVAAAEHSLTRRMFLYTTPAAIVSLVLNLYGLGHGASAWILAAMGASFVINARTLQLSNARVFRDLVQLRVDAEAANRAKSEFLATMSHEIRTPLNGVLGMTQILQQSPLAPGQREQVDVISQAGRSLLSVLNGVLDLSKIESGKLELELHAFDLEEMLRVAASPIAPLAAQKDLEFAIEIAPEARGVWRGDSTKLTQVLSNLLSNALKFTSEGRILLRVEALQEGVTFRVTDTGIGVAKDKIRHIFDRFTQADASTTRRFGGTGLGLAISHKFVSLMGGELTLASVVGQGSTFSFTLPLVRASPDALPQAHAAAMPAPEARRLRILAAEDNSTNRLILSAMLAPLEVELRFANDGQEAVEAYETEDFDVILMDAQMPRLDGNAATKAIRGLEVGRRRPRTPIIALSANVMRHQVDSYLDAGMDGYVAKPIELSALIEAIDAAVSGSSPAAALAATAP